MKIAIGNDHGAVDMKNHVMDWLVKNGYEVVNFGTDSTESTDYPIYAERVARAVVSGECDRGVLICGTGIGISISANKIHGVRAALCGDCFSAEMTRRHNDANIVALGARVVGPGLALKIVDTFLDTEFEGGRHERRVQQMMALENE